MAHHLPKQHPARQFVGSKGLRALLRKGTPRALPRKAFSRNPPSCSPIALTKRSTRALPAPRSLELSWDEAHGSLHRGQSSCLLTPFLKDTLARFSSPAWAKKASASFLHRVP